MAAFRDDMHLIAGVNEDWDENTTGAQITRPDKIGTFRLYA